MAGVQQYESNIDCGVMRHKVKTLPIHVHVDFLHLLDVRHKRPDLWVTGTWQLHHDNVPSHS